MAMIVENQITNWSSVYRSFANQGDPSSFALLIPQDDRLICTSLAPCKPGDDAGGVIFSYTNISTIPA
ncbi:hypothetical protein [Gracilimonas sp.]|uniref:hypothetical protein n=1 Tax=Gracilimonas sp. TaxID=1974203 RepID=UPI0032EE7A01